MEEVKNVKDKLHEATGLSYSFIDSKFEVLDNEQITDEEKESFYSNLSWMIPGGIAKEESKQDILKTFREENNLPAIEQNSEFDVYEDPEDAKDDDEDKGPEQLEEQPKTEDEDVKPDPEQTEETEPQEDPQQTIPEE